MAGGGILSLFLRATLALCALLVVPNSAQRLRTSSTSTSEIIPVFVPPGSDISRRNALDVQPTFGCSDVFDCEPFGTEYCDPGYTMYGRSVGLYWCRKTCGTCEGAPSSTSPAQGTPAPPTESPPPPSPPTESPPPPSPPTESPPPPTPAASISPPPAEISPPPPSITPSPPPAGAGPPPEHVELLKLVNQGRKDNGKPPLCLNAQLSDAAYKHSQDMAVNKYFDHNSQDGTTPWTRISQAGYPTGSAEAENIAAGYPTPLDVYTGWKGSPGHWENILGDYTQMGVGFYKGGSYGTYWTQDFGAAPTAACL